jgi:hypothetical protein
MLSRPELPLTRGFGCTFQFSKEVDGAMNNVDICKHPTKIGLLFFAIHYFSCRMGAQEYAALHIFPAVVCNVVPIVGQQCEQLKKVV